MAKLSVNDLEVHGKRVLVRVDFNVPLDEKDGRMVITDETRIRETLPTLQLSSPAGQAHPHLPPRTSRWPGRPLDVPGPRRRPPRRTPRPPGPLSTKPCVGPAVEAAVAAMQPGDVLLLENVRFHAGEESNDPAFAAQLAAIADIYVNDAFGTAHRAHASTEGVARIVTARGGRRPAGLLMERELKFLGDELGESGPSVRGHPRRRESFRQDQGH
jgi:phosphoglycerate kinase